MHSRRIEQASKDDDNEDDDNDDDSNDYDDDDDCPTLHLVDDSAQQLQQHNIFSRLRLGKERMHNAAGLDCSINEVKLTTERGYRVIHAAPWASLHDPLHREYRKRCRARAVLGIRFRISNTPSTSLRLRQEDPELKERIGKQLEEVDIQIRICESRRAVIQGNKLLEQQMEVRILFTTILPLLH